MFTAHFTPALRGDAIGNFEFVKEVHNSFARYVKCQQYRTISCFSVANAASSQLFLGQRTDTQKVGRKMDMLNADLLLKNEATAKKGKKRTADEDESEGGFHFIAFMPIDDQLWKLDGLERQPMCLGKRQVPSQKSHNADAIERRLGAGRLAQSSKARHRGSHGPV